MGEVRFSQSLVDMIIRHNYHSDALPLSYAFLGTYGGGQMNPLNHFDNPNNGPMCTTPACTELFRNYKRGISGSMTWVEDSVGQLNSNRMNYGEMTSAFLKRGNISKILSSFGQNSHAIADFYTHTNWTDSAERGGKVCNYMGKFSTNSPRWPGWIYSGASSTSHTVNAWEVGYVPTGMNKTSLWDENLRSTESRNIFSGTVNLAGHIPEVCREKKGGTFGDLKCVEDKTTHGYWNKDGHELAPDIKPLTLTHQENLKRQGLFHWDFYKYYSESEKGSVTNPSGVYGKDWFATNKIKKYYCSSSDSTCLQNDDTIFVSRLIENQYELSRELAIQATMKEINRLYSELQKKNIDKYFKLDKNGLNDESIEYQSFYTKD